MKQQDFSRMTDAELLVEKKKLKTARILHASLIGFLAGILLFGLVSWSLSSERQVGFLIPMLILVGIMYKLVNQPKQNKELEAVLAERNLD